MHPELPGGGGLHTTVQSICKELKWAKLAAGDTAPAMLSGAGLRGEGDPGPNLHTSSVCGQCQAAVKELPMAIAQHLVGQVFIEP